VPGTRDLETISKMQRRTCSSLRYEAERFRSKLDWIHLWLRLYDILRDPALEIQMECMVLSGYYFLTAASPNPVSSELIACQTQLK
jgi:hypothetical protein